MGETTGVYNITRLIDGDIFTQIIDSNGKHSVCDSSFALDVVPFTEENCSFTCKCRSTHRTFNIKVGKCISEKEILNLHNCSRGVFLPRANKPLYDIAKPGKARLDRSSFNNQSDVCRITNVEYFNGTEQVQLPEKEAKKLNVSRMENGSLGIEWEPNITHVVHGDIVIMHMSCKDMTSAKQNTCVLMKTKGTLTKNLEKSKINPGLCVDHSKNDPDVMLVYILVGAGSGFVFFGLLAALFACLYRRRQEKNTVSRSRHTAGSGRPFRIRNSNKTNGATMPAIHDVIFNDLIWEGDSGFSNRAITDPKVFEVDYGIPIDFIDSETSPESLREGSRNSLSPLTQPGGSTRR